MGTKILYFPHFEHKAFFEKSDFATELFWTPTTKENLEKSYKAVSEKSAFTGKIIEL